MTDYPRMPLLSLVAGAQGVLRMSATMPLTPTYLPLRQPGTTDV